MCHLHTVLYLNSTDFPGILVWQTKIPGKSVLNTVEKWSGLEKNGPSMETFVVRVIVCCAHVGVLVVRKSYL